MPFHLWFTEGIDSHSMEKKEKSFCSKKGGMYCMLLHIEVAFFSPKTAQDTH